jgi:photosystem II stability/assembly factor-like uncharacterized protein
MNDETTIMQIDQLIDEVVAAAPGPPGLGASDRGPFSPDRALLTELRRLDIVDWPDDEVGARIARSVAAAVGPGASDTPTTSPHLSPRRRRPVHPGRWLGDGVVAAAVLLLAVLATGPKAAGPEGRGRTTTTAPAGRASQTMRLVDSATSPFQSIGAGPQSGDLVCVTATVCYADDVSGGAPKGSGVQRTTDGGATWRPTAALPDDYQFTALPLSCPTTEMCIGPASVDGSPIVDARDPLRLGVTTDGGARWRIEAVASPPGVSQAAIARVACATADHCVIQVVSDATTGSGTFLFTTDAGRHWTRAVTVTPAPSMPLFLLQCDQDGSCIGLAPTGSIQQPATEAMTSFRSTDEGHTWSFSSVPFATGGGILLTSCGDSRHCMVAYPSTTGGAITIATTSDGGTTWRAAPAPPSWPSVAIAVSCPTARDCFISAADTTDGGAYATPVIEATHDGGTNWAPLVLPSVDGSPLALVYPLSCPVADGCIGVGATSDAFDSPVAVPKTPPGTLPASGWTRVGQRFIMSNISDPAGSPRPRRL